MIVRLITTCYNFSKIFSTRAFMLFEPTYRMRPTQQLEERRASMVRSLTFQNGTKEKVLRTRRTRRRRKRCVALRNRFTRSSSIIDRAAFLGQQAKCPTRPNPGRALFTFGRYRQAMATQNVATVLPVRLGRFHCKLSS
jgi:hypothetical protein